MVKEFGRIGRIRFRGTPKFKRAEIRAGAVGKMPQPLRAPLEAMNM